MKQFFKLLLSVAIVSAMLHSCQKEDIEPLKPAAGDYLLPLIETTDIHGLIVDNSTDSVHYRLAYIADKVKDIRGHGGAYKKERLLLLDGGDLYQGATISNLQQGKPIYVSFDKMEYDAVALGNHDFDWGFENMVDPDATLLDYDYNGGHYVNKVPVICANLYQHGNRVSCTKDYVIVEKTAVNPRGGNVNVKIGIIGFAEDYSLSIMASQFSGKGYSIQENYTIANSLASELEASGQCDATILLTHGAANKAAEITTAASPSQASTASRPSLSMPPATCTSSRDITPKTSTTTSFPSPTTPSPKYPGNFLGLSDTSPSTLPNTTSAAAANAPRSWATGWATSCNASAMPTLPSSTAPASVPTSLSTDSPRGTSPSPTSMTCSPSATQSMCSASPMPNCSSCLNTP